MELKEIYAPIKEDLAQVEHNLLATIKADTPFLTQLLGHILKNGGKRIRPALTLLASKFYDYRASLSIPMATAVELLHTGTLVHDDTIDNSVLRRGKPTINFLWGEASAILIGDYLFAKAATFAANTENVRVIKLFAQVLATISGGELEQIVTDFNSRRKWEYYYQWISAKTACLFSAATESGAILSQAPEEAILALRDYGYNLGITFQLVDDILDFIGEETEMGKTVGADLKQGILTLPTIIFLEHHPQDQLVREIVEKKNEKVLKQLLDQIRQPFIINECFSIASSFCSKAVKALEILPDNNIRQALFNLAEYCLQRRK